MAQYAQVTAHRLACATDGSHTPAEAIDEVIVMTAHRDWKVRRIVVKNLCPCHVQCSATTSGSG